MASLFFFFLLKHRICLYLYFFFKYRIRFYFFAKTLIGWWILYQLLIMLIIRVKRYDNHFHKIDKNCLKRLYKQTNLFINSNTRNSLHSSFFIIQQHNNMTIKSYVDNNIICCQITPPT